MVGLLIGQINIPVITVGGQLITSWNANSAYKKGSFLVKITNGYGGISPFFLASSQQRQVTFSTSCILETVFVEGEYVGIVGKFVRRYSIISKILGGNPGSEHPIVSTTLNHRRR